MTTAIIILSVLLAISVLKNISDRILKKRLFAQVEFLKHLTNRAIGLAENGRDITTEAIQIIKDEREGGTATAPNKG